MITENTSKPKKSKRPTRQSHDQQATKHFVRGINAAINALLVLDEHASADKLRFKFAAVLAQAKKTVSE